MRKYIGLGGLGCAGIVRQSGEVFDLGGFSYFPTFPEIETRERKSLEIEMGSWELLCFYVDKKGMNEAHCGSVCFVYVKRTKHGGKRNVLCSDIDLPGGQARQSSLTKPGFANKAS